MISSEDIYKSLTNKLKWFTSKSSEFKLIELLVWGSDTISKVLGYKLIFAFFLVQQHMRWGIQTFWCLGE